MRLQKKTSFTRSCKYCKEYFPTTFRKATVCYDCKVKNLSECKRGRPRRIRI